MPLLIIFIVWYMCAGRNKPEVFNKIGSNIGKIIGVLILISVFSSFIPVLGGLSIAFIALLAMLAPFLIVGYIIYKALGGGKGRNQNQSYTQSAQPQGGYSTGPSARNYNINNEPKVGSTGLTKSVAKRHKIIERFNKKYNLNLTDTEISRIADASYMSYYWEKEIADMSLDYDSVVEWYRSDAADTAWLRVYLRVFPVQTISSDFDMQGQICLDAFSEIFSDIKPAGFPNIDECVRAINDKFMTSFDEVTFMIAYRFLEIEDRHFDLPNTRVMKNETDLEKLMHKYDSTKTEDTSREKVQI